MSDAPNYAKLQSFVEAAITNRQHPVYQAGWQHSEALRYYATNVMTLETVKPEQYFTEHPQWTQQLTDAMAYCEAEQAKDLAAETEEQKLRAQVTAQSAAIADLQAKIAALTPAVEPAREPAPVVAP